MIVESRPQEGSYASEEIEPLLALLVERSESQAANRTSDRETATTDVVDLALKSEVCLIKRIAFRKARGDDLSRTAFLEFYLELIRRFIGGERGELGV
jgi:hypothetical protein